MPFVLPQGVAIGSQEAIYLKAVYDSDQTGGGSSGGSANEELAPKGYQQIAEPVAAQALTVPAGAILAVIQNNGAQPARWRDDGGSPTSALGQRILPGDMFSYRGDLSAFRIIRETAGVTLDVAYYG